MTNRSINGLTASRGKLLGINRRGAAAVCYVSMHKLHG